MMDWDEVNREFQRIFDGHQSRFGAHLPGVNFMTSELLGFVKAPDGSIVEVSTGMFLGNRIFGVTFPRVHNPDGEPDPRDQMCESLEEAFEVIFS